MKDKHKLDMNKIREHLKREDFPSLTWRCQRSFLKVNSMTKRRTMATLSLSRARTRSPMQMKKIESEASLKGSKMLSKRSWMRLKKETKMRSQKL